MTGLLENLRLLAEGARWQGLWTALAASVLTLAGGLAWATHLYVQSGFSPGLIEGQLAFDAARTRAWYAALVERGTLELYRQTQWVDFIFIAGPLSMLFVLHLMLAKARRGEPTWQRLALWFAVLGPAIASADIWENLVTLTMLQAPDSFADWQAILASSLSAVKWSWSVIGTSLVVAQLAALAWDRIGGGRAGRIAHRSDT